jgi:Fe-S cluster assembly iron-binding protein IscA
MLNVTEKAAAALGTSLQDATQKEEETFRLHRSGDGLGLAIDQERDGDQVVEHDKRKVLVIEQAIANELDGAQLDAVETPEGRRLVLQSPS